MKPSNGWLAHRLQAVAIVPTGQRAQPIGALGASHQVRTGSKTYRGLYWRIRTLGNSKLSIAVCTGEAGAVTARVVGIGPERERHPALEHLKPGDRIILLNLRQGAGASTYSETQLTAIYKLIAPVATEQLLGQ